MRQIYLAAARAAEKPPASAGAGADKEAAAERGAAPGPGHKPSAPGAPSAASFVEHVGRCMDRDSAAFVGLTVEAALVLAVTMLFEPTPGEGASCCTCHR